MWQKGCQLQGCARDLLSQDRDETLQLPRRWPRPWSSWESQELQRLAETFSVTYGKTHWQWKKLYGIINSHHGKRFLFVILWVFALYFTNYHWIINGLHHKELQLQCYKHEPLFIAINVFKDLHIENSKNYKRWYYSAAHWHTVSVMRAISPYVIFAVFDVQVLKCCR